jgi:hypothetical protein
MTMNNLLNANAGCLLIGEYVDEAESPTNMAANVGEAVRPHIIANFLDMGSTDTDLKEFTVLLKDGRVIAVRGHGLKHLPHPVAGQDIYDVIVKADGEEVSIALFKSADVSGIFHGEMRPDRKIA